jgi:hypothetical protein
MQSKRSMPMAKAGEDENQVAADKVLERARPLMHRGDCLAEREAREAELEVMG